MKSLLFHILLISFAACSSSPIEFHHIEDSKFHENEPQSYLAQYNKLGPDLKVKLASDLATILFEDFGKRVSAVKKKKAGNYIFKVGHDVLPRLRDRSEQDAMFSSFMEQPSGYNNLTIYEFINSKYYTKQLKKYSFANLENEIFIDHGWKPLNYMLIISLSIFHLRVIVEKGIEIPKYPKIYSHILMLDTISSFLPYPYNDYLKQIFAGKSNEFLWHFIFIS